MDAKITKKRLSVLLSYQWIVIAIVMVAVMAIWGVVYGIVGAKPTTGQTFNYYYDLQISNLNDDAFRSLLQDKNTFSYDVLEVDSEYISDIQVLLARSSAKEGDAIITSMSGEQKEGYISCRATEIVDNYSVYPLDDEEGGLIYDATNYLKGFLSNSNGNPLNFEELDKNLIKSNFEKRVQSARIYRNDYRTGKITVEQEYQRIAKLCEEVSFFKKVIEYDKTLPLEDSIFFRTTKFIMLANEGQEAVRDDYVEMLQYEKERPYALITSKLESANSNKAVKEYFSGLASIQNSQEIEPVIEVFNYKDAQPDLQFEVISFLNTIIRNFSDVSSKI